ncbi:MAG: SEC-C domain-containing protein [Chloroflexi bacterium]|nr:SEC-C domain-containing protein [Chloroflexota bacterium]
MGRPGSGCWWSTLLPGRHSSIAGGKKDGVQSCPAPKNGKRSVFTARSRSPSERLTPKLGAIIPCPCGSGRKYKKCHGG